MKNGLMSVRAGRIRQIKIGKTLQQSHRFLLFLLLIYRAFTMSLLKSFYHMSYSAIVFQMVQLKRI